MINLCQQLDKGDDGQPIKELCLKLDELCRIYISYNDAGTAIITLDVCNQLNIKGKLLLDVINNYFNGNIVEFSKSLRNTPGKVKSIVSNCLLSTDERKAKIDQINKELQELL